MSQLGFFVRRRITPRGFAPRCGGLALIGALGILSAGASTASAAVSCSSTASPTYHDTTLNGPVSVPANGYCDLEHVTVNGPITVGAGATLYVDFYDYSSSERSSIGGAVSATNSREVQLYYANVAGPVTLTNSGYEYIEYSHFAGGLTINGGAIPGGLDTDSVGSLTVENIPANANPDDYFNVSYVTVSGALTVSHNATPIQVSENHVGGAISITSNTGGTSSSSPFPGGISFNTSSGALSCSGNTSPSLNPFTGEGNTASAKLGQCSTF